MIRADRVKKMNLVLPNFLIIGAMKTGTTSLWNFTRHHPQVFMPAKKEIEFFSLLDNWRRGVNWYGDLFAAAKPHHRAIGEASTGYSKFPHFKDVPGRIADTLENVQLIYVVRDPVERMRSQWEHMVINWGEKRPLNEALLEDPRYMNFSRYASQLDQYLHHFDRNQILVIKSEDLKQRRTLVLERVFRLLGVDPAWMGYGDSKELYVTAERRRDRHIASLRRRGAVTRAILGQVPQPARMIYRKAATRWKPPARPEVSDNVARLIRTELKDEIARLRAFMDEDFDGWGIT